KSFHDAIKNAIPHAERGKLVTFGIIAKSPETGYGYIQRGEEVNEDSCIAYKVKRFVEKPDLDTAKLYLSSNDYYWNSG
ncbi:sugar phosphate nucleotidyltransferase, partial [Klebsiella pneumoniae]|nr:sugar phosphate nucleotidyltransferase [Klebsiella pneumoniae]